MLSGTNDSNPHQPLSSTRKSTKIISKRLTPDIYWRGAGKEK
jgi:hypothetical protein